MTKINFTKVEKSFELAKQQLLVESLTELAAIAEAAKMPDKSETFKDAEPIICRFQADLKKLKSEDPKLFEKLGLSQLEESNLLKPFVDYVSEDWLLLQTLKNRLEELKKSLHGQSKSDTQDELIVELERKRHKNKRFNVRDGWLPLR